MAAVSPPRQRGGPWTSGKCHRDQGSPLYGVAHPFRDPRESEEKGRLNGGKSPADDTGDLMDQDPLDRQGRKKELFTFSEEDCPRG